MNFTVYDLKAHIHLLFLGKWTDQQEWNQSGCHCLLAFHIYLLNCGVTGLDPKSTEDSGETLFKKLCCESDLKSPVLFSFLTRHLKSWDGKHKILTFWMFLWIAYSCKISSLPQISIALYCRIQEVLLQNLILMLHSTLGLYYKASLNRQLLSTAGERILEPVAQSVLANSKFSKSTKFHKHRYCSVEWS